jgi:hypothetical protein
LVANTFNSKAVFISKTGLLADVKFSNDDINKAALAELASSKKFLLVNGIDPFFLKLISAFLPRRRRGPQIVNSKVKIQKSKRWAVGMESF